MDTADLAPLVEDLTSTIDDLEESLIPLKDTALSTSASRLPLLDKAKLYVLATYAIESLLFSSLRLSGVDAKEHSVFRELARVKEYFAKIKAVETAGQKQSSTLDKDAADRFIKHSLAGNDRYGNQRAERAAREASNAKRKLGEMSVGTYTRLDGAEKRIRSHESRPTVGIVSAQDTLDSSEDAADPGPEATDSRALSKARRKAEKQLRRQEAKLAKLSPAGQRTDDLSSDVATDKATEDPEGKQSHTALPEHVGALDALLNTSSSSLERKAGRRRRKMRQQYLEDERAAEMR